MNYQDYKEDGGMKGGGGIVSTVAKDAAVTCDLAKKVFELVHRKCSQLVGESPVKQSEKPVNIGHAGELGSISHSLVATQECLRGIMAQLENI